MKTVIRYILKRILMMIPVLIGVSFMIFFIMDLAPGNAIDMMGDLTAEQEAAMISLYGYDRSVFYRYFLYVNNLLHGTLGTTVITGQSIAALYFQRLPATLVLALGTIVVSHLISLPLGIFSAVRSGSLWDNGSMVLALIGLSMPNFWLGLMLMIVFATNLKLLPSQGMFNVRAGYTGMRHMLDVLQHLILPCVTLVIITMPGYFRITKSSILQVTNEDFITTMRATGMSEKKIFNKYIFRNAILPTVTMFGISMAFLITGVSLIEIVFSWPGMGRLTLTAITQRDYPTLMGVYLVMSISVVIVMIITDIAYALLDPRIRYE